MSSRQQRIEQCLQAALPIQHMQLLNESHRHSRGSDSHFKLVLVSEAFAGLRAVARHQKIYGLLQAELGSGLHALTLHLYTPAEWAENSTVPESPACRGGSQHD